MPTYQKPPSWCSDCAPGAWCLRHVPEDLKQKLLEKLGPLAMTELHSRIREIINQKGFQHGLCNGTSPEYEKVEEIDPVLNQLWREYIALTDKIWDRIQPESN